VLGARTIADAHHALRLVYFIDKIYDNDVELSVTAAIPLRELFSRTIYHGGDTKKYLRALSRLEELTAA
jgi:predicted ATPase